MKKRLYSIICLCSLVSIILCACDNSADNIPETVTFQATVIEVTNNSILVEPIEGSPELSSSDQFSIPNKDGLELQTGNTIEIEYNGDIMESYPAQLGEVYNITIVSHYDNKSEEINKTDLQISSPNVAMTVAESIEDITEYEIPEQALPENAHWNEQDSLVAFGIKPGNYALSDVLYSVNGTNEIFEYIISWSPMGNYVRVGLLNEEMNELYFVRCISGKAEGIIDLTQIPVGNYFVFVYNEVDDNLNLEDLEGSITYCFN